MKYEDIKDIKGVNIYAEKLIQMIDEFREKIKCGTRDPENFLTISEIEHLWSELKGNTNVLYSNMIEETLSQIDETELVNKKKTEYLKKGIELEINKRLQHTIITMNGKLSYWRKVLRPKTKEDHEKLLKMEGISEIIPLDYYLGIANLPYKMTVDVMLEVAYWAQNQHSYEEAEETVKKVMGLEINDDTIRSVTDTIGSIVFENDCRAAKEMCTKLNQGKLSFPDNKKEGILYIETDGSALNTRLKNSAGSSWRENKLGMVFSSDNIHTWTDKHGERQHKINKREYVSYIGSVEEFKWHLLACAIRNGYGSYKKVIILGDGATWIRDMKDEIYPDGQLILDLYHLSENINTFGKDIFKMDESLYKPWVERIYSDLKSSKYKQVLQELQAIPESINERSKVNLKEYIFNNIDNIDYVKYQKEGYFVGSGAIESGNKIILQERLKQAGMRWNVKTAQHLLTLRAKEESGLWIQDVVNPVLDYYGIMV